MSENNMKNKIILHNKNTSLYLFSTFSTKTNCKTESKFLFMFNTTVTFSMVCRIRIRDGARVENH